MWSRPGGAVGGRRPGTSGVAAAAAAAPATSGLIVIERQVLPAPAQDVTFSTGVDGNAARRFVLWAQIKAAAAGNIFLRPNGLTTNLKSVGFFTRGGFGGPTFNEDAANLFLVSCDGVGWEGSIEINFAAASGLKRTGSSLVNCRRTDGNVERSEYSHCWNESVTNITSWVLHHASAGGFDTGSEFVLAKLDPIA
jgi:hypothetical protein